MNGIQRTTTSNDLKDLFSKFGNILNVHVKGRYAFIEFEQPKSAVEAVKNMHRTEYRGHELIVERTSKKKTFSNELVPAGKRGRKSGP